MAKKFTYTDVLRTWFLEQSIVTKIVVGKHFQQVYLGMSLGEAQEIWKKIKLKNK